MVIPCPVCENDVFLNDRSPGPKVECPSCDTELDVRYDSGTDEHYLTAEEG